FTAAGLAAVRGIGATTAFLANTGFDGGSAAAVALAKIAVQMAAIDSVLRLIIVGSLTEMRFDPTGSGPWALLATWTI
ncbi:MAG: hypothetical protein HON53_04375, partial [Planctomycetaceae bacterium]|nr:hypothetical protein [Planctomycetaceae bacterium]